MSKQQVISDLDIYRSANVLIRELGEGAKIEAAIRADGLLDRGDLDGYRVWQRILKAVEVLLADTPEDGETRH